MKETKTLEYKAEISNSFLKTVSAFANFITGDILFGIADDGKIVGMENPEQACLDIENKINDNITPKPDFSLIINSRTKVITLSVKKGQFTPYLYRGKAYRRSDTASIEVDQIELKRLILDGQHLYFELLAYDSDDLSFTYLSEILKNKLAVSEISGDILRTLGFYTANRQYNNAAALFADHNHFYGVDLARFGNSINEIMDRETITNVSVLRQYSQTLSMFRKYYQYEKIDGMDRKTVELIPEEAFREAIANALVHRTWDVDSHIRVAMYADRIEITSPGGLPSGLSEAEYLNGYISNLRNPIIGNVFFRLGIIEMFGTGIRRIRASYAELDCSPSFTVNDHSIMVTLPIINAAKKITPSEQQILDILSFGLVLSSSELTERTGMSRNKVIRIMNSLIDKQYVIVHGNGRGTRYSRK